MTVQKRPSEMLYCQTIYQNLIAIHPRPKNNNNHFAVAMAIGSLAVFLSTHFICNLSRLEQY